MPAPISTTNEVYRKKYFISSEKILFSKQEELTDYPKRLSAVVDASLVDMNPEPVTIGTAAETNRIKVNTIKDNQRIRELRINCPCGRHTELNVQYEPGK